MHDERNTAESLKDAIEQTMSEARMVLPGIQALFGFQLVAVFNRRFEVLTSYEQWLHLAALLLVGIAIGLVMTPAAYHRQTNLRGLSMRLLRVASVCVSAALVPLMMGLSIDIYLVARVITERPVWSLAIALFQLGVLAGLWLVFPRWKPRGRRRGQA